MQKAGTAVVTCVWIFLIIYFFSAAGGGVETAGAWSDSGSMAAQSAVGVNFAGIKVTEETENYGTESLTVDIRRPLVSGFRDAKFEKKFNEGIAAQISVAKKAAEQAASEFWRETQAQGLKPWPYVFYAEYTVNNLEVIFSLEVTTLMYTGGPGMPMTVYYNADIGQNRLIALGGLFKDDSYKSVLYDYLAGRMAEQPEKFFTESFKEISDKTKFFLRDGHLFITFAKYEVASGAMGVVEFSIPEKLIQDSLVSGYTSIFRQ